MECSICVSRFTATVRKEIKCPYCQFGACLGCVKSYLLSTSQDAHCMNCRVAWNKDFLLDVVPKTFVNKDLKAHRENVLLEREKGLMASTVSLAQEELRVRKIKAELLALEQDRKELKERMKQMDILITQKRNEMHQNPVVTDEKKTFIKQCPCDGCKGYLSNAWKCGLCNVKVCAKCHEKKEEGSEHECKPENVESAEQIKKDTKPCPACGVCVFKINGCNQMWCTSCHTAWNWSSGKVETGVVHNPEYYAYISQQMGRNIGQPRAIGDVPCGGFPLTQNLHAHFFNIKFDIQQASMKHIMNVLRCLQHIQYYEIPAYPLMDATSNVELRIKYLLNDYTEDKFKHELQKKEKKNAKNTAIRLVFDMFIAVGTDLFNTIMNTSDHETITSTYQEFLQVRTHVNTALLQTAKKYDISKIGQINEHWIYKMQDV